MCPYYGQLLSRREWQKVWISSVLSAESIIGLISFGNVNANKYQKIVQTINVRIFISIFIACPSKGHQLNYLQNWLDNRKWIVFVHRYELKMIRLNIVRVIFHHHDGWKEVIFRIKISMKQWKKDWNYWQFMLSF